METTTLIVSKLPNRRLKQFWRSILKFYFEIPDGRLFRLKLTNIRDILAVLDYKFWISTHLEFRCLYEVALKLKQHIFHSEGLCLDFTFLCDFLQKYPDFQRATLYTYIAHISNKPLPSGNGPFDDESVPINIEAFFE